MPCQQKCSIKYELFNLLIHILNTVRNGMEKAYQCIEFAVGGIYPHLMYENIVYHMCIKYNNRSLISSLLQNKRNYSLNVGSDWNY